MRDDYGPPMKHEAAFGCMFLMLFVLNILFWGAVIFIALHFILKWW